MKEYIGNVELDYSYYDEKDVYNEGDEVEEKILDTLKQTTDYRDHLNVIAGDDRWPILYQLSKQRENIIEPMEIGKEDEVLEIGAGMGAVTGAIASRAKHVDCVELSKRRSLANGYRNRTYNNIRIIVGNYQKIQLKKEYDVITLIGVFEYAQNYISGQNPYGDFLKDIYRNLKPGGKLYIAIENKLGMKYFAGCVEDHIGRSFAGIEGYDNESMVRTFTKSQLEQLLSDNGFCDLYFYYPYPDYKLPVQIYSDDYLPQKNDRLPAVTSYDLDRIVVFDEEKVFESLKGTEEIKVFFNSFLVEAVKINV